MSNFSTTEYTYEWAPAHIFEGRYQIRTHTGTIKLKYPMTTSEQVWTVRVTHRDMYLRTNHNLQYPIDTVVVAF